MNSFIITAGGIGKRMGAKVPKQFLLLQDKPILMWTIEVFYNYDQNAQLIVTLPKEWWSFWEELCQKNNFNIPHELIEGGKERFHSIQRALKVVKGDKVAIHDGVRPLVSVKTLENCFKALEKSDAVVPVLPLKESLRKGTLEKSISQDRSLYFTAQTPQCFTAEIIKKAYQQEFQKLFTDDASVVETLDYPVLLVYGNEENIKITSPLDLKMAEVFLNSTDTSTPKI